jgi:hypothetical protein
VLLPAQSVLILCCNLRGAGRGSSGLAFDRLLTRRDCFVTLHSLMLPRVVCTMMIAYVPSHTRCSCCLRRSSTTKSLGVQPRRALRSVCRADTPCFILLMLLLLPLMLLLSLMRMRIPLLPLVRCLFRQTWSTLQGPSASSSYVVGHSIHPRLRAV